MELCIGLNSLFEGSCLAREETKSPVEKNQSVDQSKTRIGWGVEELAVLQKGGS